MKRFLDQLDIEMAYAFRHISESDYKFLLNKNILLEDIESSELGTHADKRRETERATYMMNQATIWGYLVSKYSELDNNVKIFMHFASWYPKFINTNDRYPTNEDAESWYEKEGYLYRNEI